jgi:hypothetical protein
MSTDASSRGGPTRSQDENGRGVRVGRIPGKDVGVIKKPVG